MSVATYHTHHLSPSIHFFHAHSNRNPNRNRTFFLPPPLLPHFTTKQRLAAVAAARHALANQLHSRRKAAAATLTREVNAYVSGRHATPADVAAVQITPCRADLSACVRSAELRTWDKKATAFSIQMDPSALPKHFKFPNHNATLQEWMEPTEKEIPDHFVCISSNGRATLNNGLAALYISAPEGCSMWNKEMTKAGEEVQETLQESGRRAAEQKDNRFKHDLERQRSSPTDPHGPLAAYHFGFWWHLVQDKKSIKSLKLTSNTEKYRCAFERFLDTIKPATSLLNRLFCGLKNKRWESWRRARALVVKEHPDFDFSQMGAAQLCVPNLNCCALAHRNVQDDNWCWLIVLGDFKGGDLVLLTIGTVVECRPGTTIFFQSSLLEHWVTKWKGTRHSIVFTTKSLLVKKSQ